jgi:ADP-ribose pyrophosphatase
MKFEILNSETMYSGRAFGVARCEVRLPDGRLSHYDLVEHRGAVTLVPVDDQGRILLVNQYRLGADRELWELPAGVLEANEPPEEAAAREVREETGFAARELRKLGEFYMAPGYSREFMHVYLASGLYAAPLQADADEFLQLSAVPVQECYAMIRRGEIVDGKTIASLLLAQPYL